MTEHDGVRTESATDELRRMLDERGMEHYDGTESTLWGYEDYNEFTGIYRFSADETSDGYMQVRLWRVTPEQAVASTLGRGMLTADDVRDLIERHSDASGGNGRDFHNGAYMAIADELNATLGESSRLPHFWTHDGTLHIEATRMPTRIVVCEGGTCEFVPKRELDTSEAENAKLRELADGWDFCSKTKSSTFDNCVGCPLFIQTLHSYRCARDERMRELGVDE